MQLFGYICLFLALFVTVFCEDANTQTEKNGLEGKLSELISKLDINNVEEKELSNGETDETEEVELDDVQEKGLMDGEESESDGEVTVENEDLEMRSTSSSSILCRRRRYAGNKITCIPVRPCVKNRRCRKCSRRRVCKRYGGSPRRCLEYTYKTYCHYVTCPCPPRICTIESFYLCL